MGALLLGVLEDVLHYVGTMDSGFDQKTIRDTATVLTTRSDSPFRRPIPES